MLTRYFALAMLILTSAAHALSWQKVVTTPTAISVQSPIEYEIAREESFASKSLVDQGYGQSSTLTGNLPAGLYYLRHRLAPSNANPGAWSVPIELLVTAQTTTSFIEPLDNTRMESPTPSTAVLYRWKRIEGATLYTLTLQGPGKPLTFNTKNPFFTTELAYGNWTATLQVFIGPKKVSVSSPLKMVIEPTTQEGVQFLKPQNDDVLEANKKNYLHVLRRYTPTRSTLHVHSVQATGANQTVITRDVSPTGLSIALPPLAPGPYQVTIIDQLNSQATVESNMLIHAEVDPLMAMSQGSQTIAEFSLGLLLGEAYQNNHYLQKLKIKNEADGPRVNVIIRNASFDPYQLEFRGEALNGRARVNELFPVYAHSHQELGFSLSALYRISRSTVTNQAFLRGGVFSKQYHQVSEGLSFFNGNYQMVQETPVRLWGVITGLDWQWQSWSSRWSTRFSGRLMFPFFSTSMRIATGSVSPKPSAEFSADFKRALSDYIYLTLSPALKYEYWKVSETNSAHGDSVQYQLRYGLQLGLGMEL